MHRPTGQAVCAKGARRSKTEHLTACAGAVDEGRLPTGPPTGRRPGRAAPPIRPSTRGRAGYTGRRRPPRWARAAETGFAYVETTSFPPGIALRASPLRRPARRCWKPYIPRALFLNGQSPLCQGQKAGGVDEGGGMSARSGWLFHVASLTRLPMERWRCESVGFGMAARFGRRSVRQCRHGTCRRPFGP